MASGSCSRTEFKWICTRKTIKYDNLNLTFSVFGVTLWDRYSWCWAPHGQHKQILQSEVWGCDSSAAEVQIFWGWLPLCAGHVVSDLLLRSFKTVWNVGNCVLSDPTSWPRRF